MHVGFMHSTLDLRTRSARKETNVPLKAVRDTLITLLRVAIYRPNRQYKPRTAKMA